MAGPRIRLGQLLVDARILSPPQLEQVLALQKTDSRRLGTLLVEGGFVSETQLTQILSQQLSVPWASLHHIDFSRQLLNLVPRQVAEKYCLVPIYVRNVRGQGETLYVAMDDPSNEEALRECSHWSGLPARAMIASPSDIQSAIRVYYGAATTSLAPHAKASPSADLNPAPAPAPAPKPQANAVAPARSPALAAAPPPPAFAAPAPIASAASLASVPAPPPSIRQSGLGHAVSAAPLLGGPSPQGGFPAVAAYADAPEVEVAEIEIPRPARGRTPRMLSLTLLDGTTLKLPAARRRARPSESEGASEPARTPRSVPPLVAGARAGEARGPESQPPPETGTEQLTARDLVAALRAVSHGADADEILGEDVRWEKMFAALLSVLLRKHLIADWEFIDEFKKI